MYEFKILLYRIRELELDNNMNEYFTLINLLQSEIGEKVNIVKELEIEGDEEGVLIIDQNMIDEVIAKVYRKNMMITTIKIIVSSARRVIDPLLSPINMNKTVLKGSVISNDF